MTVRGFLVLDSNATEYLVELPQAGRSRLRTIQISERNGREWVPVSTESQAHLKLRMPVLAVLIQYLSGLQVLWTTHPTPEQWNPQSLARTASDRDSPV